MDTITSNLFTNRTNKNKNNNKHITETSTTFSQKEPNTIYPSPGLIQGNKFKKYQNKITKKIITNTDINSKEGFTANTLEEEREARKNQEYTKKLFDETTHVIKETDYSPQTDRITILKKEYQNTLNKYNTLLNQINGITTNYFGRVNSSNPYLGKNIYSTVSPGPLGYVTMQGVFKWYPNWNIVNATAGLNGCPGITQETWKSAISVNVPIDYNNPGAVIQTNPPLIVGTPMVAGQSCGNEGSNVFVNNLINNPSIAYEGCFQDSTTNPTMTFIGDKPTNGLSKITNSLFSDPRIGNNSYKYFNDNSSVPGWNVANAALINNSRAWGYKMPYPYGDQCISIQMTSFISQVVSLEKDVSYTLSFYGSGRNCCDGSKKSNPITIFINSVNDTNSNNTNSNAIYSFEAVINEWNRYTTNFTIPTTGNHILKFQGMYSQGDRSTAIQNIQILDTSINQSQKGKFSIDTCKEAALSGGYQYFALQDVNPSSALGYCAVSNSQPSATKLGAAYIPNKLISIWSTNTAGQPGNSATLTQNGSLSILNSSGTIVFSTDASTAQPSNYLGCYNDCYTGRGLPVSIAIGSNTGYNYDKCAAVASQKGYSYFGLQFTQPSGTSECWLGNDINLARGMGKATNCTKVKNQPVGGSCSNAIYTTNSKINFYFLILQDDGNMCVYRGTGPNDNQGTIWCSSTNGKQQKANPNYQALKSKYGKNWISTGDTLAIGDFVGSNDGSIYLIMQSDGNLVLYTSDNVENCSKMTDGQIGGGITANALYNIGQQAISGNIGKLGYVDPNAQLHMYPSSNTQFNQNYSRFTGNNPGNDIAGTSFSNATLEQCKNTCSSNNTCAGFVYDNKNNICFPKNNSIYPNTKLVSNSENTDFSTYIRNKQPATTPLGVPKSVKNTDSITYQNYSNGGPLGDKYGLAQYTSIQQQELSQLESTLNMLSSQLNELTGKYVSSNQLVDDQVSKNQLGLVDYSGQMIDTDKKIKSFPLGANPIIEDSNIVLLQKNYEYLLWSSLAIGVVIVTMGYYRK